MRLQLHLWFIFSWLTVTIQSHSIFTMNDQSFREFHSPVVTLTLSDSQSCTPTVIVTLTVSHWLITHSLTEWVTLTDWVAHGSVTLTHTRPHGTWPNHSLTCLLCWLTLTVTLTDSVTVHSDSHTHDSGSQRSNSTVTVVTLNSTATVYYTVLRAWGMHPSIIILM